MSRNRNSDPCEIVSGGRLIYYGSGWCSDSPGFKSNPGSPSGPLQCVYSKRKNREVLNVGKVSKVESIHFCRYVLLGRCVIPRLGTNSSETMIRYRYLFPVFRIRDVLIWIRILGSVHCITDPYPALYASGFQKPTKNNFFLKFSCLSFTLGTYTDFKDGKSLRSHKKVEINFYLLYSYGWKDPDPYK
jgi:hypothetical protein